MIEFYRESPGEANKFSMGILPVSNLHKKTWADVHATSIRKRPVKRPVLILALPRIAERAGRIFRVDRISDLPPDQLRHRLKPHQIRLLAAFIVGHPLNIHRGKARRFNFIFSVLMMKGDRWHDGSETTLPRPIHHGRESPSGRYAPSDFARGIIDDDFTLARSGLIGKIRLR